MSDTLGDLVEDLGVLGPPPAAAAAPRRAALPWHLRLLELLSAYLPVLLMALLALGTWWLVKNTPLPEPERAAAPPRHEPDYTMSDFRVQRFAADGTMRVQIEGTRMRHYPDNDTLEVDLPRIRAIAADGRVTLASAQRALANGDGSEIQLIGAARVQREALGPQEAIEFRGEFLHAFRDGERVRSHLPVLVRQGTSELRADAMEYDNLARVVDLKGRTRAVFDPPRRPGAPAANPGSP
jgi:lipopolysaccharide export system protein LptC